MELLVKPEILTSYIYIYIYIFLQFNKLGGEMVALLDAAITSAILDLISRVTLALFVTEQPR
jgi:hypothetical protein